jgi:uncharacterized protein
VQIKEVFPATLLRVHFDESDVWNGKPLHEALIAKCQDLCISGAIVFRGIEGYGAGVKIHHTGLLSFSKDAPLMLSVIDTEQKVATLMPHLDVMVQEGLIAISKVEAIRYSGNAA